MAQTPAGTGSVFFRLAIGGAWLKNPRMTNHDMLPLQHFVPSRNICDVVKQLNCPCPCFVCHVLHKAEENNSGNFLTVAKVDS